MVDVILSLTGKQTYPGGEPEVIELITKGTLEKTENGWAVCYEESDLTGLSGVTTRFLLEEKQITLHRSGKLTSTMVFQEGVSHTSLYELEIGALMLTVCAQKVAYSITEKGGTVDLLYTIEIEQSDVGIIEYHLDMKAEHQV